MAINFGNHKDSKEEMRMRMEREREMRMKEDRMHREREHMHHERMMQEQHMREQRMREERIREQRMREQMHRQHMHHMHHTTGADVVGAILGAAVGAVVQESTSRVQEAQKPKKVYQYYAVCPYCGAPRNESLPYCEYCQSSLVILENEDK